MHRHGYKGRKFNRETDQRRSMMKSLADSLIEHGSIETTLPKAKELRPYVEKLITKAKKGDLHSRRIILSRLHTTESTHKLVDDIAPKLTHRNSGYLRIERTSLRRGDNAQMARISFVDTTTDTDSPAAEEPSVQQEPGDEGKSEPAAKKTAAPSKAASKKKVKAS